MTVKKGIVLRVLSWVHSMLIFEGVCVLSAGMGHMGSGELARFLLQGAGLIVPVAVTDILVRRCKRLWVFCIFGAVIVWAIELLTRSQLMGWLAVFICLFRCYVKLKQGEIRRKLRELPGEAGSAVISESMEFWEVPTLLDDPGPVHCLVFILLYLGLVAVGSHGLLRLMLGFLAAEILICLAYGYLRQLSAFTEKNRCVANLPVKAMKRTGAGILGVGMILLLFAMLPAALCHEESLTKVRWEAPQAENSRREENYEESGQTDHLMEELMRIRASAKKTPPWLKAASKLVSILMLAWLAYLALKMVFAAVRRAAEAFSDDSEDEVVFLKTDDGDKENDRKITGRVKNRGLFSSDKRVRRIYKRAIKCRMKGSILGSETPAELEGKAGFYSAGSEVPERTELHTAHEIYEKARYGKEECTKEDVKRCVHIFSSFNR